jgi:hypothetical protein
MNADKFSESNNSEGGNDDSDSDGNYVTIMN